MASEIIVDFAAIQLVADIMANAEKEIDSVTTEIYYIKGDVSDGWSGEAKEMFVENCHTLRQKGVEVTYNLQPSTLVLEFNIEFFHACPAF